MSEQERREELLRTIQACEEELRDPNAHPEDVASYRHELAIARQALRKLGRA